MNTDLNSFIKSPKLTNKSTDSTSYYGMDIRTTMGNLIKILGLPNGEGCVKVNYCWNCELSTGEVFTIYDWKSPKKIEMNDIVSFHIGGFNKNDTVRARNVILKELGDNHYNG